MIIPINPDLDIQTADQVVRDVINTLLAASDWTQLPDSPADKAAWATYRAQLRDIPNNWVPSSTLTVPDPPA